jgi:hypothetical protein
VVGDIERLFEDIERLCSVFLLVFEDSGLDERPALDVLVGRPRVVAALLKHEHLIGLLLVVCQKRHMRWRKRPHARARKHTVSLPSSQGASERRSQRGERASKKSRRERRKEMVVGGENREKGGKGEEKREEEKRATHISDTSLGLVTFQTRV